MSRNRKPSFRIMDDSFDTTSSRCLTENNSGKRKSRNVSHVKEKRSKPTEMKSKTQMEDSTKERNVEDLKNTDDLHHILKDHTIADNYCTRKKKHVKFDEKSIKQTKPDLENDKIECEASPGDTAGKKIESVVRKLKSRPSKPRKSEDTVLKVVNKIESASVASEVSTDDSENVTKNRQMSTRNRKNRATKCITKNDAIKIDVPNVQESSSENCDFLNKENISNTKNTTSCNKIKKHSIKKTKKNLCKSLNTRGIKAKPILEEYMKKEPNNIIFNNTKKSTTEDVSVTVESVENKENSKQSGLASQTRSINVDKTSFSTEISVQSLVTNVANKMEMEQNVNDNCETISNLQVDDEILHASGNTEKITSDNCVMSENSKTGEESNNIVEKSASNSSQQVDTNILSTEAQDGFVEMCNTISESVLLKTTGKEIIDMKKTLNDTFESQSSKNQLDIGSEKLCKDSINEEITADVNQDKEDMEQNIPDDKNVDLQRKDSSCNADILPSSLTNMKDCKNDVKYDRKLLDDKKTTVLPPIENVMEDHGEPNKIDEAMVNICEETSFDMKTTTQPASMKTIENNIKDQAEEPVENCDDNTVLSSLDSNCTILNQEIKKSLSNEDCKVGEEGTPYFPGDLTTIKSEDNNQNNTDITYILPSLLNLSNPSVGNAEMSEVLNEHIKEEASTPTVNEVLYICEECEFETKIVNDFTYHYTLSHGQKHQEVQRNAFCAEASQQRGEVNGEVFTLYVKQGSTPGCGTGNPMTVQPALKTRERKSRRLLVYDDSSGEELKMYQCGLCDFKTRYGKNLEVHYRLTHGLLLELFECSHPECHFVTFLKDSLFHHYRTQHVEVGVLVRTLQSAPPSAGK